MPVMRPSYREEPSRSALTRVENMPFSWSLNPYVGCVHRCAFCYVRAFEQRAERPSGPAYGRSIRVKTNIVELLRRELARRSWRGEEIALGSATDPYQPAEGRYRLTRGCIEVLARAANPFGLVTRSPLIVRDIDVLGEAARRAEVSVVFSVPTLDSEVWRVTEPGTAPPQQRLRALGRLARAGIACSVAVAPILPGLSDRPEQLDAVVAAASAAGARAVWARPLRLSPGTREHFFATLVDAWPELVPAYEELYAGRASPPASLGSGLSTTVGALARRHGIGAERRWPVLRPAPAPQQLVLEL
jgi:DNA repair photolyase